MSFAIGVLFFVLGSAVVALCLAAIPGRDAGQTADNASHGHHGHGSAH
ncbi:MAG: hypothetical protein KGJ66_00680 [Alphaproteobacteria bacterium]|nr:hypothetical protein [Alphaproteobacteria bacterium]